MAEVHRNVRLFLDHGPKDGRAISFFEPTRIKLADEPGLEFWRNIYPLDLEDTLLGEAYARLARIIDGLPAVFRPVLEAHYHLCGYYAFQSVVLQRLLQEENRPLCIVLAGSGAQEQVACVKVEGDSVPPEGFAPDPRDLKIPFGRVWVLFGLPPFVLRLLRKAWGMLVPKAIVLIVEDSGSAINLGPAIAIARAIQSRGSRVLCLSSSPYVVEGMRAEGQIAKLMETDLVDDAMMVEARRLANQCIAALDVHVRDSDATDRLLTANFHAKLVSWARDVKAMQMAVERLAAPTVVQAVLTIGPAHPLAIIAGRAARQCGRTWWAYLPNLINATIEDNFFPADRYLVYGEHARDIMVRGGTAAEAIDVVGTPQFDRHVGTPRDKGIDRRQVESLFPGIIGNRLVVLGTERRPNEMGELVPVVEALAAMDGVYTIIKVHPDESPFPFEDLVQEYGTGRFEVVQACDLRMLLSAADLLICSASNINIQAAQLGTPALVVSLAVEPYRIDFVSEGLCIGVRKREEIGPTILGILTDDETRKRAKNLARTGIRRFNGPNDGRSVERVVDAILG